MTLYEIDTQIKQFLDDLMNSCTQDGEVTIDLTKLDELKEERAAKIENIALYIKDLEADSEAIKKEIASLTERKNAMDNKAEWLRNLLSQSMQSHEEEKFSTSKCSVSFKRSEAVIIPDIELLDPLYKTVEVNYKADKNYIKKKIKEGTEIRGAWLEQRNNIQIK